jgi:hypothetical protein
MISSTRWVGGAVALLAFAALPALSFAGAGCGDSTGAGGSGAGSGGGPSGELVCKLLESDVPGCVCDFSMQDEPVDDCSEAAGDGYFCCATGGFPDDGSCRCQPGCSRQNDGSSCTCNPGVASIEGDSTFVADCSEDDWLECCTFTGASGCVCGNTEDTCGAEGAIPAADCNPGTIECSDGSTRAESCNG